MQTNFYNWYRSRFKQMAAKPPSNAWESISDSLDIDESWENISHSLDNYEGKKRIRKVAYVSIALTLIIGIGSAMLLFDTSTNSHLVTVNDTNYKVSQNNAFQSDIGHPSEKFNDVVEKKLISSITNKNTVTTASYQHTSKQSTVNNAIYIDIQKADLAFIPPLNQLPFTLSYVKDVRGYAPYTLPTSDSNKNNLHKRFYIGTIFSLNNIWLLNHDTYNGLKSKKLITTKLNFGKEYGLIIGYNLTDRISAQSELMLYSEHGQKYSEYNEGKYVSTEINLKYTNLNILFKYKKIFKQLKGKNNSFVNYIIGGYWGIMHNANEIVNEISIPVYNNYSNMDYGLHLGLEYGINIKDKWMPTLGLRTSVGSKNIYSGNEKIPADFNVTRNSSIVIYIGLIHLIDNKR